MNEQRKFARVNYPCAITVWRKDGLSEVIMANAANISAGGLCVYLNRWFENDKELDIKIDNVTEGSSVRCSAHVVHCTEDAKNKDAKQKFYQVGVQFDKIDDKQRELLMGFIERLQSAKKSV